MKNYQFQVLRYLHDGATGEFVNVGLAFFEPESKILFCRVTHRYRRISEFFNEVHGSYILKMLRIVENSIHRISKQLPGELDFNKFTSIDQITTFVLPKNDSALRCSEVYKGLTLNAEKTFDDLYSRFVSKYEDGNRKRSRTDEDAWREVYKKFFDKNGITEKLNEHRVKTKMYEFNFQHAWKNGVWNIYNPVSFDLIDKLTIEDKVFKWVGKIKEMESSEEKIKIWFLALFPHGNELKSERNFIMQLLKEAGAKNEIDIIDEESAERFAEKVKLQLNSSSS